MKSPYTSDFSDIRMSDLQRVGGKNASLGELFAALRPKGVGVLDGVRHNDRCLVARGARPRV